MWWEPEIEDLITTERVAVVVYRLMLGERLTTAAVADLTGISWSGAYYMMTKISRVAPVVQCSGHWLVTSRLEF